MLIYFTNKYGYPQGKIDWKYHNWNKEDSRLENNAIFNSPIGSYKTVPVAGAVYSAATAVKVKNGIKAHFYLCVRSEWVQEVEPYLDLLYGKVSIK